MSSSLKSTQQLKERVEKHEQKFSADVQRLDDQVAKLWECDQCNQCNHRAGDSLFVAHAGSIEEVYRVVCLEKERGNLGLMHGDAVPF